MTCRGAQLRITCVASSWARTVTSATWPRRSRSLATSKRLRGTTKTWEVTRMNTTSGRSQYDLGVARRGPDLLAYERALVKRGEVVVGLDEVGRGALAGPITVGAVVITHAARPPEGTHGLQDCSARPSASPSSRRSSRGRRTGRSVRRVPVEIDRWGLRVALAVAANRAMGGTEHCSRRTL